MTDKNHQKSREESLKMTKRQGICFLAACAALGGGARIFFDNLNSSHNIAKITHNRAYIMMASNKGRGGENVSAGYDQAIKTYPRINESQNYTVEVSSPKSMSQVEPVGSAVLIDNDGTLVTAAHVVDNTEKYNNQVAIVAQKSRLDYRAGFAELLYVNHDLDLAIMKLPPNLVYMFKLSPAELSGQPGIGAEVAGIGYPGIARNRLDISLGKYLGIVTGMQDKCLAQEEMELYPGKSGGPVSTVENKTYAIALSTRLRGNDQESRTNSHGFGLPMELVLAAKNMLTLQNSGSIKIDGTLIPEGIYPREISGMRDKVPQIEWPNLKYQATRFKIAPDSPLLDNPACLRQLRALTH